MGNIVIEFLVEAFVVTPDVASVPERTAGSAIQRIEDAAPASADAERLCRQMQRTGSQAELFQKRTNAREGLQLTLGRSTIVIHPVEYVSPGLSAQTLTRAFAWRLALQ